MEYVRTYDATQQPTWAAPKFWFSLKGVNQAGSCAQWINGAALFASSDKQALALVLAAQASGQEIAVAYNDNVTLNSLCVASYVTIGSPAPLY